jgi:hypothetical protein
MANIGDFDHWKGGEQSPVPPEGTLTFSFDYWEGNEMIFVYSKAKDFAYFASHYYPAFKRASQ